MNGLFLVVQDFSKTNIFRMFENGIIQCSTLNDKNKSKNKNNNHSKKRRHTNKKEINNVVIKRIRLKMVGFMGWMGEFGCSAIVKNALFSRSPFVDE